MIKKKITLICLLTISILFQVSCGDDKDELKVNDRKGYVMINSQKYDWYAETEATKHEENDFSHAVLDNLYGENYDWHFNVNLSDDYDYIYSDGTHPTVPKNMFEMRIIVDNDDWDPLESRKGSKLEVEQIKLCYGPDGFYTSIFSVSKIEEGYISYESGLVENDGYVELNFHNVVIKGFFKELDNEAGTVKINGSIRYGLFNDFFCN